MIQEPIETADPSASPEETETQPRRTLPTAVLFSASENRLRAGWRLLVQAVLLVILLFGLQFILDYFLTPRVGFLEKGLFLTTQVLLLISVTVSVFFARVFLDQRSVGSLGLALDWQTLREYLLGVGISGLVMGLIFLLEWSFGWLKFQSFAWEARSVDAVLLDGLVFLLIFLSVSWQEELLFRGYWLQNLEDGLNILWAVGISSLFFAFAHWGNPQFALVPLIGLFLSSLLLTYGYLATRRLWLPIGLHFGWNFFGGLVFGFPVGGLTVPAVINHSLSGPEWLTGGGFGPESGVILLPALALGFFLIWAYQIYSSPTA
ncbi:MAG: type II CAAX endopeptidase family protein [Anaerolineales bacterium]|nr:type II CAAX endopeptidase family protein [Anaerolineales bacterium]